MSELAWLIIILLVAAVWWLNLRLGRLESLLRERELPVSPSYEPAAQNVDDEPPSEAAPVEAEKVEDEEPADPPPEPPSQPFPVPEPASASFEEKLTQRWFVWLGALVTGLGALFLVRAAADAGIFSPRMRLAAAGLGGLASLVLAEWLVRRTDTDKLNPLVPAALAAAGSSAIFAAVWAASALYGFLPASSALIIMAGVAFLTLVMALRHGQLLAWLGLGGGLAAPVLAGDPEGSVEALLTYVAALFLTSFLVLRWRSWRGFLWMLLPAIWFYPVLAIFDRPPGLAVAIFLTVVGIGGLALPAEGRSRRWWRGVFQLILAMLWLVQLTHADHATQQLVVFLIGLTAILIVCQVRGFGPNAWVMPIAGLFALASMDLGHWDWSAWEKVTTAPDAFNVAQATLVPTQLGTVWRFAAGLCAVTVLVGLAAVARARRSGQWASIAAFIPLLALTVLYMRLGSIAGMPQILVIAVLVHAAAATLLTAQYRKTGQARPTAAMALAALGALALVAAILLTQAWLPLALTVLAYAAVVLWRRLRVRSLLLAAPWLAWSAATIALLDPRLAGVVSGYGPAGWGVVVAGTLLPAVVLWFAAREISRSAIEKLKSRIQLAALVFVILAIGHATSLIAAQTSAQALVEAGLRLTAWLGTLAWLIGFARNSRLFGIAVAVHLLLILLVALPVLIDRNPLWSGWPVGRLLILNLLLPAYGLPVVGLLLLTLGCRRATRYRPGWSKLEVLCAVATLLAFLFYAGLEIRRAFHGPILTGRIVDAELYAYSVLLLAVAAVLLTVGIVRDRLDWRRAGIAVLTSALLKLFLVDLAHLDGILRAVSFLGLGFSLIAVGYAFRRWATTSTASPNPSV